MSNTYCTVLQYIRTTTLEVHVGAAEHYSAHASKAGLDGQTATTVALSLRQGGPDQTHEHKVTPTSKC